MEISTPWLSLFGGMLIGLSAVLLMLFSGKVAGISGTISGLFKWKKNDSGWRIFFVAGLMLSAFLLKPLGFSLPDISDSNIWLIAVAGFLVGFGSKLANGCTSGHGIVGMGRLSKRSIYATVIFMCCAILVVLIRRLIGV